ncbi:hypothetical protein OC845_003898 [Tilletia horrida]|nr:hypothetical protein OC845_003898 [Tilletia horrida]
MALRLAGSGLLSISCTSSSSSTLPPVGSRCLPWLSQPSTLLRRSTVADVGLRFHHQQHHQHRQTLEQRTQSPRRRLPGSVSSSVSISRSLATSSSSPSPSELPPSNVLATYQGPLHTTFRRLKVFSLSSLVFAGVLTPYLLLGPGSLDTFARVALVITALSASSASTALISWIGKPYVAKLELVRAASPSAAQNDPLPPSSTHLVAHTTSWRLQPLSTTIYQPGYIRGTSRPFAQWQLAADPPAVPVDAPPSTSAKLRSLIAETRLTKTGAVVGQYWVEWRPDALTRAPVIPTQAEVGELQEKTAAQPQWRMEGVCKIEGKPVRHYNVHEELLNDDWRVLE